MLCIGHQPRRRSATLSSQCVPHLVYSRNVSNLFHVYSRLYHLQANLPLIRSLEKVEGKPGVYGITRFADRTPEEFAATRFGRKKDSSERHDIPLAQPLSYDVNDLPKEIDWHSLGGTTKIYDQGECGSCWAFSATEQVKLLPSNLIFTHCLTLYMLTQAYRSSQCGG